MTRFRKSLHAIFVGLMLAAVLLVASPAVPASANHCFYIYKVIWDVAGVYWQPSTINAPYDRVYYNQQVDAVTGDVNGWVQRKDGGYVRRAALSYWGTYCYTYP